MPGTPPSHIRARYRRNGNPKLPSALSTRGADFHFATARTPEGVHWYQVIRSIEVGLMARIDLFAKIPLIGMSLVFLAMFIVAVTAYLHLGWYSIIGYAIAAVVAVAGFVMTFRDIRDTPGPPEQWDVRGTPIDPASPRN